MAAPEPKRHQARIRHARRQAGNALREVIGLRLMNLQESPRPPRRERRDELGRLREEPPSRLLIEARPSTRAWRRQKRRDGRRALQRFNKDAARQARQSRHVMPPRVSPKEWLAKQAQQQQG